MADGGIGLKAELENQFPGLQFILDKTHLKDHLYETVEASGIPKKDRWEWVRPFKKYQRGGDRKGKGRIGNGI
ncbi:hypothetical protein QUF90_10250 [Desulfococcaceae bacterium HSG9]|nr:hypothetical protein [Desulfococcaceae bacterium HSG9]